MSGKISEVVGMDTYDLKVRRTRISPTSYQSAQIWSISCLIRTKISVRYHFNYSYIES